MLGTEGAERRVLRTLGTHSTGHGKACNNSVTIWLVSFCGDMHVKGETELQRERKKENQEQEKKEESQTTD